MHLPHGACNKVMEVRLFWCFLWYFKGESITLMWWHNIDWYPCNHRFDWNPCIYGTIGNWLKVWTQRRAKSQFVTPVAFLMTLKENLLHCRLFYHLLYNILSFMILIFHLTPLCHSESIAHYSITLLMAWKIQNEN